MPLQCYPQGRFDCWSVNARWTKLSCGGQPDIWRLGGCNYFSAQRERSYVNKNRCVSVAKARATYTQSSRHNTIAGRARFSCPGFRLTDETSKWSMPKPSTPTSVTIAYASIGRVATLVLTAASYAPHNWEKRLQIRQPLSFLLRKKPATPGSFPLGKRM